MFLQALLCIVEQLHRSVVLRLLLGVAQLGIFRVSFDENLHVIHGGKLQPQFLSDELFSVFLFLLNVLCYCGAIRLQNFIPMRSLALCFDKPLFGGINVGQCLGVRIPARGEKRLACDLELSNFFIDRCLSNAAAYLQRELLTAQPRMIAASHGFFSRM